ncbi:hypothetical protein BJ165DRAFT_959638 [Panaeolus papilionaceus]|nr:hypothetical protein BJ165DRAFT_959638 [Panaeolus papilionaceus]
MQADFYLDFHIATNDVSNTPSLHHVPTQTVYLAHDIFPFSWFLFEKGALLPSATRITRPWKQWLSYHPVPRQKVVSQVKKFSHRVLRHKNSVNQQWLLDCSSFTTEACFPQRRIHNSITLVGRQHKSASHHCHSINANHYQSLLTKHQPSVATGSVTARLSP